MWALRRVPNPLKDRRISVGASYAFSANRKVSSNNREEKAAILGSLQSICDGRLSLSNLCHSRHASSNFSLGRCAFSSQAGAESSSEEDDLDGFSELETPTNKNSNDEKEESLFSDPEMSGDEQDDETGQNELELLDTETDPGGKKSYSKTYTSELLKAVIFTSPFSIHNVLDKWLEDGNALSKAEVSATMIGLRRRRMYERALQVSEWLEASKQLEFTEREYASRVDLIAKKRGLQKAEQYIEKVPKTFRGEIIYRTLLANCVAANNLRKAEGVFNKMKDLEFPITSFACNQLLLMYKRVDKKKIADVLLLMEKENVRPSLFTYKILIDTKGQSNDINGMDQIVETMKAEGIEPDRHTQSILAKHYISAGLAEKAEGVLKEMEGDDIKNHRWACHFLLPLYAQLGRADEVERVWKVCESGHRIEDYIAAIEAWGKLGKIEEAEAIFDKLLKNKKNIPSRCYVTLLKVYSSHKMVQKGKYLVKQMADNVSTLGPLTWDALVKLYVEAGEVEKAESILQKASQQRQRKPLYNSYMTVMEQYSKKGDIHNSEKMFHRMKQAGYEARLRQFQSLVQAYINAKAPAYGIRDRMKAENIFPNKALAAQLVQVDAFRKTPLSDLLD